MTKYVLVKVYIPDKYYSTMSQSQDTKSICIEVYFETKNHLYLDVKLSDTIRDVKSKLFRISGQPPCRQCIVYSAQILKDERSIESYDIRERSAISVLFSFDRSEDEVQSSRIKEKLEEYKRKVEEYERKVKELEDGKFTLSSQLVGDKVRRVNFYYEKEIGDDNYGRKTPDIRKCVYTVSNETESEAETRFKNDNPEVKAYTKEVFYTKISPPRPGHIEFEIRLQYYVLEYNEAQPMLRQLKTYSDGYVELPSGVNGIISGSRFVFACHY